MEKSEDAEFARRLPGAGPEALLGAAEGAIRAGRCGGMQGGELSDPFNKLAIRLLHNLSQAPTMIL